MRNAMWTGLACAALAVMTVGCSGGPNLSNTRRSRITSQDFADSQYTTHAQYLRELGASYTAEERYMDAMEVYTDSLTVNYGEDFESQVAMGRLWERRGDKNRSLAHYARAQNIRPDHIAGWYALRRVKPYMQILPNGEQADGHNPNTASDGDDGDEDDDG
jgi:tetratricopeptide (TPR) repeat protein